MQGAMNLRYPIRCSAMLSVLLVTTVACDGAADPTGAQPIVNRPPTAGEATPAEVVVTPRVDTLSALGQTVSLGAVVVGQDGSVVAGLAVSWVSLAPGVATVGASSGTVTSVGAGSAVIRASAGAVSGDAVVVVLSPGSG